MLFCFPKMAEIIKKNWILLTSIIFIVFSITNVSASIYFSQLDSVYNLGEMVEMNVTVSPDNLGPLRIVLLCDNNTLDVYKGAPTDLIQLPLTTLWMNGMTGDCHFTGYYGGEVKESTGFKISKKLDISLYTTSFFADPGETIKISGNAKRLNGEGINGDVEIRIPLLSSENTNSEENIYGIVSNGEFSVDYIINKDTPAGDYRIDVVAYERTENERTSEGITTAGVQVSQVIKSIDIALDTQNIEPGNAINFKPILNDQSDNPLVGNVAIEIRDENSNEIMQKIVKSGETIEYIVPNNQTAGYYEIEASSDSLTKIKKFHVSEKALASFELTNGTLVIKNIGNVPYNKTIEVTINGRTFFIKPEQLGGAILPGERKEFKLSSDKETNSVKIDDKVTNLTLDNVSLPVAKEAGVGVTGASVGLGDLISTPITWIIILVILAAIILFLFRDIFKKRSVAYPAPIRNKFDIINSPTKVIRFDNKGREIESIGRTRSQESVKGEVDERGEKNLSPMISDKKINPSYAPYKYPYSTQNKETQSTEIAQDTTKSVMSLPGVKIIGQGRTDSPSVAEQTLVTDGQKNRAAVIALKIKNTINKFSKENLEKAIEHVYDKKGAVYEHGNFIFIIFSPLITKSFRNEIEATRAAEKIAEGLKEHNKKFSDKIEFGIAINSGDIISKIEDKKLKFTSLGTLTISAKKLADLSNGEVLLTKEAYEKAMTEVKADKKEINGTEVYEVKKVADYEKNKKFINDFLKREKESRSRNMIPDHAKEIKSNPYWMKDETKKEDAPLPDINDNQNNNI